MISEFWRQKYLRESQKSWNLFYKRNKNNFFRDRHWTDREFEILNQDSPYILLEMGCGVGNFILPILEKHRNITSIACDTSPRATEILSQNEVFIENSSRCTIFVCDISDSSGPFFEKISKVSVDIVSLIFVLSAFDSENHRQVIRNAYWVLKSGGRILFRDYAKNDHTQYRFDKDRQIDNDMYVRQDGTLAYFFTLEYLSQIFESEGFKCIQHEYVKRKTMNIKVDLNAERIFVQSQWEKIQ